MAAPMARYTIRASLRSFRALGQTNQIRSGSVNWKKTEKIPFLWLLDCEKNSVLGLQHYLVYPYFFSVKTAKSSKTNRTAKWNRVYGIDVFGRFRWIDARWSSSSCWRCGETNTARYGAARLGSAGLVTARWSRCGCKPRQQQDTIYHFLSSHLSRQSIVHHSCVLLQGSIKF